MAFQCSFAAVEQILASLNYIADDRRPAFASRVKNLQRMRYPPGINTGRGIAAVYHAEHVVQLGLAVELLQLGLTPERAVKTLAGHRTTIIQALADELLPDLLEAKGYEFFGMSKTFLGFDPEAFSEYSNPPEGANEPEDISSYTFVYGDKETLDRWLENANLEEGIRLAIIPFTRFIYRIFDRVETLLGTDSRRDFCMSLADWAMNGADD